MIWKGQNVYFIINGEERDLVAFELDPRETYKPAFSLMNCTIKILPVKS